MASHLDARRHQKSSVCAKSPFERARMRISLAAMLWCDHCGHAFVPPDPEQLRRMPQLKKDHEEVPPLAVVCPVCDTVHRVLQPN